MDKNQDQPETVQEDEGAAKVVIHMYRKRKTLPGPNDVPHYVSLWKTPIPHCSGNPCQTGYASIPIRNVPILSARLAFSAISVQDYML